MGTYTFAEYLAIFGGVPEPGEYAPDLRALADHQRDEADEFPWQTAAAPASAVAPVPPCGGSCGPEGCMARGCPVGQDVAREDEYTASEAAADAAMDRDYFEAHEHDDVDPLRDEHEPFEDGDEGDEDER